MPILQMPFPAHLFPPTPEGHRHPHQTERFDTRGHRQDIDTHTRRGTRGTRGHRHHTWRGVFVGGGGGSEGDRGYTVLPDPAPLGTQDADTGRRHPHDRTERQDTDTHRTDRAQTPTPRRAFLSAASRAVRRCFAAGTGGAVWLCWLQIRPCWRGMGRRTYERERCGAASKPGVF